MPAKARYKLLIYYPAMVLLVLLACISIFHNTAYSQRYPAYTEARTKLISTLKKSNIDKAFTDAIDRFYFNTCDSLINKKVTIDSKPVKEILTRLFVACEQHINNRFITFLRIPSVNNNFLLTVRNYKKQPVRILYREISISQSSILEEAFEGIALGDSITTFVGIREMLNTPEYISSRLYQARYLPYKDTLLHFLANSAPEILTKKLAENDSLFTTLVKSSRNITVQAVSQIKKDIYYDKTLPFSLAILEKRITTEEIKKLTLVPQDYYKAFIEEMISLHTRAEPGRRSFLEQPVANLNKTLAYQYFICEINMLHELPDKMRFQVIDNCSARELYFILTGGSGELYTSSFLYLYKKFIKESEAEGLEKFFTDIDYYQFDQFIATISGYGLVDDLVKHMEEEQVAGMLGKYLTRLTSKQLTDNEIILKAMTMSEIIHSVRHHRELKELLLSHLQQIEKTNIQYDIMLQRMYQGFKLQLLDENGYDYDSTYTMLTVNRLQRNNSMVQVCFFYNDEDGCNTFDKSTATYRSGSWDKKELENYIVFISKTGNNMRVYMNKPMTISGCDAAQDDMLSTIKQEGYEATSFIHRGHSYHLYQSLRKITASAQFVFLGSCGGYNEVMKLFQLNPDVNIIATRNIGSSQVNDPLLHKINMALVNNKNIIWNDLWQEFNAGLPSKQTKDLFSSYIAPDKYIGIKFIRKLFNY